MSTGNCGRRISESSNLNIRGAHVSWIHFRAIQHDIVFFLYTTCAYAHWKRHVWLCQIIICRGYPVSEYALQLSRRLRVMTYLVRLWVVGNGGMSRMFANRKFIEWIFTPESWSPTVLSPRRYYPEKRSFHIVFAPYYFHFVSFSSSRFFFLRFSLRRFSPSKHASPIVFTKHIIFTLKFFLP